MTQGEPLADLSRLEPVSLAGIMRREYGNFRVGRRIGMGRPGLHSPDDVQFCRINTSSKMEYNV